MQLTPPEFQMGVEKGDLTFSKCGSMTAPAPEEGVCMLRETARSQRPSHVVVAIFRVAKQQVSVFGVGVLLLV
jgi:hypothetical protein